jgi:hypothetical protein
MFPSRKHVEPTAEQLQMALRQLRRPFWPEGLDACLAHPIYGPCIRGLARTLARAKPTVAAARPACAPAATVPPTPSQAEVRRPRQGFKPAQAMLPFDARRAAANDFDRDD